MLAEYYLILRNLRTNVPAQILSRRQTKCGYEQEKRCRYEESYATSYTHHGQNYADTSHLRATVSEIFVYAVALHFLFHLHLQHPKPVHAQKCPGARYIRTRFAGIGLKNKCMWILLFPNYCQCESGEQFGVMRSEKLPKHRCSTSTTSPALFVQGVAFRHHIHGHCI